MRATVWRIGLAASCLLACSSKPSSGFGVTPDSGAGSGTGTGFNTFNPGGSSGTSAGMLGQPDGSTTASSTNGCTVTDPNTDMDKDGWTPMQGDCDDCDPNINPGAIDVLHTPDGGMPYWGDEDCSGNAGDNAKPCDQGLMLDDVDPNDAAKAIELCATATMTDRKYGVISASFVRANGAAFANGPGVQVGIQSGYGPNVHVQGGMNMLAMSSGAARTVGQTGACNGISCSYNATATAPTGFPEDDPDCPPTKVIADDVALQLVVRVPTNATGYSFNFKFHSFEFPDWVCDPKGYNDQFVALVTPAPMGAYVPSGSMAGNISFDMNKHPVSVNLGFFDVCDPTTPKRFAQHCKSGSGVTCPAVPNPYCPLGVTELASTGFDVWNKDGPDGATRWLASQAPVTPGSVITLLFAIWDAGNGEYDSTVLIDNFQWNATGGVITVGTAPIITPK